MAHRLKHTPAQPIRSVHRHWALLVVLAIYLGLTLGYGQLNPLGEAPDEIAHMDLIRFIGEQGHLPRDAAERQAAGYKSAWPMLYHALVGAATHWIDYEALPRLKVNDATPRRLLIEDGLSPFALIHTEDEAFPYQGIVLSWHLARLASTLMSAGTLLIAYLTCLAIRPGDRWLALGTTALIAAIPQFHFIASAVNDDNLLGLLAAAFTLGLVRVWQQPGRRRAYAWLGLWLGLAMTTKYSVSLLPLLVASVLFVATRRGILGWRAALGRLLIFALAMLAASAWWFIYIEWFFNEVQELGLVAGLIKPLMSTGGSDASTQLLASVLTRGLIQAPGSSLANASLWDWTTTLFRTFWFVEGEASRLVVNLISLLFLGLTGMAVAGVWRAGRRAEMLPRPLLALLILYISLLVAFPLLRFYLIRNPAETGQGRHILFPAAIPVGLLLAIGVSGWFPAAYRRFVGLGLAALLTAISLVSFLGLVLPAFPPPLPVRSSAGALDDVPNPVHMALGDGIELAGYTIGAVNPYAALPVTLFWHSREYASQDYLIELSLRAGQGGAHTLWLGHPLDGHYPTRAWEPGDVLRDTLWLPVAGLAAGDYDLHLRLRSTAGPVPTGADRSTPPTTAAGQALVTRIHLSTTPTLTPGSQRPLADRYSFILWQAGQPASGFPRYHYRAAIPITIIPSPTSHLQPPIPDPQSPPVSLIGPDNQPRPPAAHAGDTLIFLVDAFWPSGDYALRVDGLEQAFTSAPILRVQVRQRNFDVPPMSVPVHANFADEIMLLGYDFPERRAQPGGALPITLYWQALRPMSYDYVVSNHLLNSSDLRQWGGRDRLPRDYYSTTLWTPGEVVQDAYWVPVDPLAPPGVYRLDIGLYVALFGETWYLPLMADGETLGANSITIAPIKVAGPPPGVTVASPAPHHPQVAHLGDWITLLGYDWNLEPGALSLALYWRADARPPADYTTFVHVRDATGQVTGQAGSIVAQMDRPPAEGAYPTSLWDAGEIIRDVVRVPIPSQVPAGEYEVIVGLYNPITGERLPALDDSRRPLGDYVRLEEMIVHGPSQSPR